VSEKASLQSELSSLQADIRKKTREVEDLKNHLHSTRQHLEENERTKLSLVEEKAHMERVMSQMSGHREEMERSLQKVKMALEDTHQENTELISKVTSQAAELHSLKETNMGLQSKLSMAELLAQQLSTEAVFPSFPHSDNVSSLTNQLRGEVERLERVVRSVSGERDQALSDLDALRDAMVQLQHDSSEKNSKLHSKLMESEAERLSLLGQLQDMQQREDQLAEHASTEHAQLQQSAQAAMEMLQQEKDKLQVQLQSQVEENRRLSQSVEWLEHRAGEAERESLRLREAAVDSQSLLDTISHDKEALSQAMAQNRELKSQLVELQDAFVRMSEQSMQLATDLETERFTVTRLQAQQEAMEEERLTHSQKEGEEVTITLTEEGSEGVTMTEVQAQMEEEGEAEPSRAEEVRTEASSQTSGGEGEGRGREGEQGGMLARGESMDVQPEYTHLAALLQATELERDSLHQQLQALSEERDGLHREVVQLHSQVADMASHGSDSLSTSHNDRDSPHEDSRGPPPDTADMTQDILSALQANFNALQVYI
jgi:chromosome segregation ATPase